MKKKIVKMMLSAAAGAAVLFSVTAGVYICALAGISDRPGKGSVFPGSPHAEYATASNAAGKNENAGNPATGDAALKNETAGTPAADIGTAGTATASNAAAGGAVLNNSLKETVYTVDSYDFWYACFPLSVELGGAFDQDQELPGTVAVYLEGPDGILDDAVSLNTKWDLSEVDFSREGDYTVSGTLDTSSCEYPVDWEHALGLSFTLSVVQGGTLSFSPETDGDTLILSYEMNQEPFVLSYLSFDLYESLDGGASWQNITRSTRVCIDENRLSISGVESDRLFQLTGLRLGGFYSFCSDIVQAEADGSVNTVRILSSGGRQGGENWSEEAGSIWDREPVMDGPYPILEYRAGIRIPSPPLLKVPVSAGKPESMNWDLYNSVYICYGDRQGGVWSAKVLVPVEWDQVEVNAINWNQEGDTVIHGQFSEEILREYDSLLDFKSMPELTLTISVYTMKNSFGMRAPEEALQDHNRLELEFFCDPDGENTPLDFGGTLGLTVWCSVDGNENWYDITDTPTVSLDGTALSVSYLKEEFLRGYGYTFQIEQTKDTGLERFSASSNVSLDEDMLLCFGWDVGGDRGGGKRYEKPPFEMFGSEFHEEGNPGPAPTVPETEETTKEDETPVESGSSAENGSSAESGPSEENGSSAESGPSAEDGSSAGGGSDSENENGKESRPDNTGGHSGSGSGTDTGSSSGSGSGGNSGRRPAVQPPTPAGDAFAPLPAAAGAVTAEPSSKAAASQDVPDSTAYIAPVKAPGISDSSGSQTGSADSGDKASGNMIPGSMAAEDTAHGSAYSGSTTPGSTVPGSADSEIEMRNPSQSATLAETADTPAATGQQDTGRRNPLLRTILRLLFGGAAVGAGIFAGIYMTRRR